MTSSLNVLAVINNMNKDYVMLNGNSTYDCDLSARLNRIA